MHCAFTSALSFTSLPSSTSTPTPSMSLLHLPWPCAQRSDVHSSHSFYLSLSPTVCYFSPSLSVSVCARRPLFRFSFSTAKGKTAAVSPAARAHLCALSHSISLSRSLPYTPCLCLTRSLSVASAFPTQLSAGYISFFFFVLFFFLLLLEYC